MVKRYRLCKYVIIAVLSLLLLVSSDLISVYFILGKEKRDAHLSIDDVNLCLQDLVEQEYESVFEQPFFGYLKRLHKLTGAKFTLYVYERSGNFNINKLPYNFANELKTNKSWLKFGYHTDIPEFEPERIDTIFFASFKNTNTALCKFAGNQSVAKSLRLGYFYMTDSIVSCLVHEGVNMLFTSDKEEQRPKKREEKISFVKTDYRLESNFLFLHELLNHKSDTFLVAFTHEWYLSDIIPRMKLLLLCYYLNLCNYTFRCE